MKPIEKISLRSGTLEAGSARREYAVRFIRAGRARAAGNRPSDLEIPAEAIQNALQKGLFEARAAFVDHAGWAEYPSLTRLVGVSFDARWNEADQAADGVIRLYDSPQANALAAVLDAMLHDAGQGQPCPDVGLSLVFWPRWAEGSRETSGEPTRRLAEFLHIESIDFVFEPAADGRILQALSSLSISPQEGTPMDAQESAPNIAPPTPAARPEAVQAPASVQSPSPAADPAASWQTAAAQASVSAILAASGLPQASRERLSAQSFANPEALQAAIEAERLYLARLQADQVIHLHGPAPRSPQVSVGRSGAEQFEQAFEALLSGRRPPSGVQPLSGIREAYVLLSGDYEMNGVFHGERVTLANANSATMASLVANALNKRVIEMFAEYPHWWEPIVSYEDFATLQQVRWITLGGIGELPTVAEGAAYNELNWDDQTETADFVKKGGYLGISLEAIDKDDTRKLQAAPRALAQAAWLTLSKTLSAIFTANNGAGPNMSDGVALFNAAHGNLGALALSHANYVAVRTAMRKQTELNSGERLGALTAPKFLLVPPDLEISAQVVLASEQVSGGANNDANAFAQGDSLSARMQAARERVIVVDLWTDTNDWAAVADPRLYPTLGVGFRYGRTPEVFSVASPTAGLMFTNDTLPIKVRFFFAAGPMDYRGLYKNNV